MSSGYTPDADKAMHQRDGTSEFETGRGPRMGPCDSDRQCGASFARQTDQGEAKNAEPVRQKVLTKEQHARVQLARKIREKLHKELSTVEQPTAKQMLEVAESSINWDQVAQELLEE